VGQVSGLPLLSLLIAVPLAAGVLCLVVGARAARWVALWTYSPTRRAKVVVPVR
jgi:NADH:ubiquinone oxidoreductase subunit 4 (subunit M)